jgi:hypothetical protein
MAALGPSRQSGRGQMPDETRLEVIGRGSNRPFNDIGNDIGPEPTKAGRLP